MKHATITAVVCALALSACSSASLTSSAPSPSVRVYEAQSALVTMQAGALAYSQQPACGSLGASAPPACSNKTTVKTIASLSGSAVTAIKAARAVVNDTTAPQATVLGKITAAEIAITAFQTILKQQGISY